MCVCLTGPCVWCAGCLSCVVIVSYVVVVCHCVVLCWICLCVCCHGRVWVLCVYEKCDCCQIVACIKLGVACMCVDVVLFYVPFVCVLWFVLMYVWFVLVALFCLCVVCSVL